MARTKKKKKETEKTPAEEEADEGPLKFDAILHGVAKTYRSKSKALLEFMANTSNIRWDEKGKLTIDNVVLPHSNIAELVNDAARDTKKRRQAPNGRTQLSQALQRAGVPKNLIGSRNFWNAADSSLNHSRVLAASSQQQEEDLFKTVTSHSGSPLSSSSPQQRQQKGGARKWITWRS